MRRGKTFFVASFSCYLTSWGGSSSLSNLFICIWCDEEMNLLVSSLYLYSMWRGGETLPVLSLYLYSMWRGGETLPVSSLYLYLTWRGDEPPCLSLYLYSMWRGGETLPVSSLYLYSMWWGDEPPRLFIYIRRDREGKPSLSHLFDCNWRDREPTLKTSQLRLGNGMGHG